MYVLFSFTIFLLSSVFAQTDVSLPDNLSIQSYDKANESAKVKTGYLGRSFLPSLTFELGQEKFQTGRYKTYSNPYGMLEAKLNLFRGGRDNIESGIRDLQAQIGKYNLDSAGRDELNKVRKIQTRHALHITTTSTTMREESGRGQGDRHLQVGEVHVAIARGNQTGKMGFKFGGFAAGSRCRRRRPGGGGAWCHGTGR